MRLTLSILSILFIMTFASIAVAEQSKVVTTTQKNIQTAKVQSSINRTSDIDLYKLLYENSADSNTRIISTIQWAIGIISTFVIVLLGSQILFNYRVNKEEIRAIRSELEEKFYELKIDVLSGANKERKELIEKFEGELSSMEIEIKDSISMHYGEKDKYIDVKLESFNKDTIRLKSELESEVGYLKVKISELAGEVWKLKGVDANALKSFIELINLKIDRGFDVKHSLDNIIETLQSIVRISQEDLASLTLMLERVPDEYQASKLKIKELCSSLPQYIYVDDPARPGYLKTVDV